MKKVLLINEGGLANLGDEAIRRALERLVEEANCELNWARFSGRERNKDIRAVRRRPVWERAVKKIVQRLLPREFLWLLKNWKLFPAYFRANDYDLILIGGGQLIQSNGTFDLAMFLWVYLFKKIHKKKVILIGVGATERYSYFGKFLYSKSLQAVDGIYARDKDSVSVFENVFHVSAKLIPDIAFYINKIYEHPVYKEKRALFCPAGYEFYRRKRDKPGIGLDENEYLHYWQNQVLEYSNNNYQVKLFCTNRGQDLVFVEKLKQSLYDEHGLDIGILDISTLEELTGEIAQSEVIVSARMHPLIIGYSYGCKLVPYKTSEKIETFEKEYINTNLRLDEVQMRIVSTIQEVVGDKINN